MTAVAIVREKEKDSPDAFRAVARAENMQAVGRTAGEALDALTAQLGSEDTGTIVIVQQMQPDRYFNVEQILRLQFLMRRSQEAAEGSEPPLSSQEEAERNKLIEAELLASAQRASALADALGR